jgi:uncharacterized protein YbjT (DUF2867 family)
VAGRSNFIVYNEREETLLLKNYKNNLHLIFHSIFPKIKMSSKILVTSATGAQGGSVVRQLLSQNITVNALVRDPTSSSALALESLGVTLFKGDHYDIPAITAAISGCTGVFLNTFPSFEDPDGEGKQAQNFIDAAHHAKTVTTFIASTVARPSDEDLVGKEVEYPFIHFYYKQKKGVEDRVRSAGFKYYTIFRPGFLMYNLLSPWTQYHFPEYPTSHIMTVHWGPDYKIDLFDPVDVGKFAAAAFVDPENFNGTEINLVNEKLTTGQLAEKISKATGIEVKAQFATEKESEELVKAGTFPTAQSQTFCKKYLANVGRGHLEKYGITLGTFDRYLEREKESFLKTLGA